MVLELTLSHLLMNSQPVVTNICLSKFVNYLNSGGSLDKEPQVSIILDHVKMYKIHIKPS